MKATAERILAGDRRSLARAITLVESERPDHRAQSLELLSLLRSSDRQGLRVGLSGTPGSGKSTLIEQLGLMLADAENRVAVLAVDPSSTRSGGSILGDKTRMERLARHHNAFIRPSPSRMALGGVSARTREVIALCEAAGFDTIIIETMGVGQSEILVSEMSDVFVLILGPAGGDELQGVKRGVIEISDFVLVNKADGDLEAAARQTCAEYAGALRLLSSRPCDPDGVPMAMTISARFGTGLATAWKQITALAEWRRRSGFWDSNRTRQEVRWFEAEVDRCLLDEIRTVPGLAEVRTEVALGVSNGGIDPGEGAVRVIEWFRTRQSPN